MASDDNDYYGCCHGGGDQDNDSEYHQSASDDDGGFTDDDDLMYDDQEEDDDGEEEEEDQVEEVEEEEEEKMYGVLSEDAVRARQDEYTARVADLISVPPAFAAVVLRHCKWSATAVEERWFSDEEQQRIRDAVGLPCGGAPVARNGAPLLCAICLDEYPPGGMRSAGGCAHFYCVECWRGYVRAAVGDGPLCLSLRCPDPACTVAVVRDLVDEVADDRDRARYTRFALRSYVEESCSRKKVRPLRWCPAPGCTLAVEFLGAGRCRERLDVVCWCGHAFCLSCGEEAHRPVACDTVAEWLAKNSTESETASWVLDHAKHCPECRRPIEKNMGCMHMTCSAPCLHQFCWLCLGPWSEHGGGVYQCNRYSAARQEGKLTNEEVRRQQGKASIDRYLHFYERWAANDQSRRKALEDMAELESPGGDLELLAGALGEDRTKLAFVMEAYAQVAECRRRLRWTYAYGYYMPVDTPAVKRELFECLQSDAEAFLERLHGCAEKERRSLVYGDDDGEEEDPAATYRRYSRYQEKLVRLTRLTQNHFENLVTALENDLAEVKVTVEGTPVRRAAIATDRTSSFG